MIKVGIITVSDKGYKGEREDLSGKIIAEMVREVGGEVISYALIPDEKEIISNTIIDYVEKKALDLIVTTGGTGVSPRDVTPEATKEVLDKEIPGMGEAMRLKGLETTPHAMISRALAGVRKRSLIVNLPGSPSGVRENLGAILMAIPHAIAKIQGDPAECAPPKN
ncbi:MAG: MogA/MoaB family molybdenum cofactor biosynthesis protein [Dehalococcoidia bacterium]|nr:MogA/MoaB family molybdenum cofactor biosynthesis protein [Dehalococcoidia bacterium]